MRNVSIKMFHKKLAKSFITAYDYSYLYAVSLCMCMKNIHMYISISIYAKITVVVLGCLEFLLSGCLIFVI